MKPVLIVAPYFAPQTHAAMFRMHKLVKYLPDHGWKPYVLTVDTNYLYNEDPELFGELPPEVEIIRARYVEPTVRGVRMALGGPDRTFVTMKSAAMQDASAPSSAVSRQSPRQVASRAAGSAYAHVRSTWLSTPDPLWTWRLPAIRAGRKLIERYGISVVLTTSMPYTPLQVGRALQGSGAKWIADFRDPAGYGWKMTSSVPRVADRQQEILRDTLRHADAITTTAVSNDLIFTDLLGEPPKGPVTWIPTGVDEALIPPDPVPKSGSPYLVYIGEVMPDQTETFFAILGQAFRQERRNHRLLVIGHEILNRRRLQPVVEKYGYANRVAFIDHIPQAEVYRYLMGATAGILAPGRSSYWWNLHAKLVDYAGLQVPVIALVPDPSEARSVLVKTRLGVFLDGNDDEATTILTKFLDGDLQVPEPNIVECSRFLASTQVQSFVHVIDGCVQA